MKRTPRVLAAVVAATALTFTGVHTADAKPDRAGTHAKAEKSAKTEKAAKAKSGKGAMSKLDREIARKVAQLERTVSEQRLRRVDPVHAAVVVENVEADQADLEALVEAPASTASTASTTEETAPVADVRATLKTYRPENYRLAVNILRQAAKAGETTTEAETLALDESVALALQITATSSKADVKAARAAFAEATALLEDDADETAELDETEDGVDDDVDDDTEDDADEPATS